MDAQKEAELICICRCKRLWGALFLDALFSGKPLNTLCKQYDTTITEIEAMNRSVNVMANRLQRFCGEIGWLQLERLLGHCKSFLSVGAATELKELLEIPHVTPKLAKLLFDKGIRTATDVAAQSAVEMAHTVQLASNFDMQVALKSLHKQCLFR